MFGGMSNEPSRGWSPGAFAVFFVAVQSSGPRRIGLILPLLAGGQDARGIVYDAPTTLS
jgi:hypothetical protein